MRDSEYWDRFYATAHPDIQGPTTFAQTCLERIEAGSSLYELGCGNGRDVQFYAAAGLRVIACDRSSVAIERLRDRLAERELEHRPDLRVADMSDLPPIPGELDVIYSRFTLHAVTADEASRALTWAYQSLAPGGQLMAEARSVLGSLYGVGDEVARDTYLEGGHRRRFIRAGELSAELEGLGFAIDELIESDGLAVYKTDDPVVVRIWARK